MFIVQQVLEKKVLKIRDPIIYPLHWWQICINTITILSSFGKCLNVLTFPWRKWSIKTLVHSLNQMRRVTITNFLFWVNIPKLLQSTSFKDLQISKRLRTSTNLKKIHTYIFFKNFQDFMLSNQFTEGKVSLEHHLHKECWLNYEAIFFELFEFLFVRKKRGRSMEQHFEICKTF